MGGRYNVRIEAFMVAVEGGLFFVLRFKALFLLLFYFIMIRASRTHLVGSNDALASLIWLKRYKDKHACILLVCPPNFEKKKMWQVFNYPE